MANKRFDELSKHPQTLANPLNVRQNDVLVPIRDPSLASDNTKKVIARDLIPHPEANIINFGADPTSTNDSTAAIQAAIDSLGQGGTVYVPPGGFVITQIQLKEGIHLKGANQQESWLIQRDGVDSLNLAAAIVLKPAEVALTYSHAVVISDLTLDKYDGNGIPGGMVDRIGRGIYFDSNCGEGTKFHNISVKGFPQGGILVEGAICCWMQDIHVFHCGDLATNVTGYGVHVRAKPANSNYSFAGHYLLGISGDTNAPALICVENASAWICGVKCEASRYCLETFNSGNDRKWVHISNATHVQFVPPASAPLCAFIHIKTPGRVAVHSQGVRTYEGWYAPANYLLDDVNSRTLPWKDPNNIQTQLESYYSPAFGGELFSLDSSLGAFLRIGQDPPNLGTVGIPAHFALGNTNGVGLGTSGNITALAKGAATNAPTSLVVNKWVRAQLNGVDGWIPFFV